MQILSISIGKAQRLFGIDHPNYESVLSGINKSPVSTIENPLPIAINKLGAEGDEQADLEVHGGIEKALYAYPVEHYEFWQSKYTEETGQLASWHHGQFGENLTISGITEADVFVGDTWMIGDVILRVVKLREPCFKFNAKMGFKTAAKTMVQTAKSGWYLSVIQTGFIKAGDPIIIQSGERTINITQQNQRLLSKYKT